MAKGTPGRGKFQIPKLSLDEFKNTEDAISGARLGVLADHQELSSLLKMYYWQLKVEKKELEMLEAAYSGKETVLDRAQVDRLQQVKGLYERAVAGIQKKRGALGKHIGGLMTEALRNQDFGFFKTLSDLIWLQNEEIAAVSAVDHAFLVLLQVRDIERLDAEFKRIESGISDKRLREACLESTQLGASIAMMDFPEWPPTVTELHKWLSERGIDCDEKAVRNVMNKHGITPRLAMLGAPKSKKNK